MTIIDTTSDTVTSQFVEEDIRSTGKLTDCKLHFIDGPLRVSSSSASRSGSVAVVAMSCHVPRTAIHSGSSWA